MQCSRPMQACFNQKRPGQGVAVKGCISRRVQVCLDTYSSITHLLTRASRCSTFRN